MSMRHSALTVTLAEALRDCVARSGDYLAMADEALAAYEAPTPTLQELLEQWSVHEPGTWSNDVGPAGWYAVSNTDGIVAYFGDEAAAFRFRLAEINRELNG